MVSESRTTPSLRGRNYENQARARQLATNESLARRLKNTRFSGARYPSPSRYESPTQPTRPPLSPQRRSKQRSNLNREMELVQGISDRLDTGLNEQALKSILDLLKRGEHPDAIVAVVTSLAQQQSR